MTALLATARTAPARPGEADGGLPFPFLMLCWRIGLAGQWIRTPRASEPAEAPFAGFGRELTPGRDPLLAREGLNSSRPLWHALERSRFVQRLSAVDPPGAVAAASATLALLLAAPAPPRTRRVPPLWRPLTAAVVDGAARIWIPRPHPRYDPLTWTLLERLHDEWEAEGLTFLGRERRQLYLRMGTRRMARTYRVSQRRALGCGRTAHRIWRRWYESAEGPREARIRGLPLPAALQRALGDPARVYRAIRYARRRGIEVPYGTLLPAPLRRLMVREADASIRSFPAPPATSRWPRDPLPILARALGRSPLGPAAREAALGEDEVRVLARALAGGLLKYLTAPWPWGRLRCLS